MIVYVYLMVQPDDTFSWSYMLYEKFGGNKNSTIFLI